MAKRQRFAVGDEVWWAGERYTVWSLHARSGWYWISRNGCKAIEAKGTSLTLAIPVTGAQEKATGMARALMSEPQREWREQFRAAVEARARRGDTFTSEDIVEAVGLPVGSTGMNRNNAVGAMMNGLARRGVIRKTERRVPSRRPTSHSAELVVWTGAAA